MAKKKAATVEKRSKGPGMAVDVYKRQKQDVDDLEYGRYGRFQAQIAANKALSFQSCAGIFPEMED